MAAAAAEAKAQYSAIVLGATGNVGGRIVQLLIKNPLCKKVVVVTRRKTDAFADPKVSEVVVNMDRLEEAVAPEAQGARRVRRRQGQREYARGGGAQDRNRLPAGLLPRRQGGRCSCVRAHDSSGRGPRGRDEVREDHRREGEGCRVRQVRLPRAVPSRRHSRQLQ